MLYMPECKYNIVLRLYICTQIATTVTHSLIPILILCVLINIHISYIFNLQSCFTLAQAAIFSMIHTGALYISCIRFLPDDGPARAKTSRRRW